MLELQYRFKISKISMKYLITAAHPDDQVLCFGAAMAKWSNEGAEVYSLIMTEGATPRDKSRVKSMTISVCSMLKDIL